GQSHARARHRFLTIELGPTQTALELQHDAPDPAVGDEQVVATTHDGHGELLALGIEERVADVIDVLWHDEDVRRAPDAQRRMEAEHLLEPDFTPDLA